MDKNHETIRAAMDMMLDMMAEAGDQRAIFTKKVSELHDACGEFIRDFNISDDKLKELSNLLDQFLKMINDFKEEK